MHHQQYMNRCFQLALLGNGKVAPNPMVGAVLVYNDLIIGEGYHQKYGEAHAEVNCINSVAYQNTGLIEKSILYVSLEPCAHFGKTPPCADLIIRHKIPEVVIGCRDSFDEVDGKGIERLQQAGIKVTIGMLEAEARQLNKRFFTFNEKKRPYIFLKWAQSADGFIAKENLQPVNISNELTNRYTHHMRAQEAAILIGTRTALHDDPSLTTRHWTGANPARIVIDKKLALPAGAKLLGKEAHTIVLNEQKEGVEENVEYRLLRKDEEFSLQLIRLFNEKKLSSLIIEGGRETLQYFIDQDLWDEALVITNQKLKIGAGVPAPILSHKTLSRQWTLREDQLQLFKRG